MKIELVDTSSKLSMVILADKINELIEAHNNLAEKATKNRGPKSDRAMSEDDARRVIYGDMKDLSHNKAAEELGLSYGQVYSARKEFTFKAIHKELRDAQKSLGIESSSDE